MQSSDSHNGPLSETSEPQPVPNFVSAEQSPDFTQSDSLSGFQSQKVLWPEGEKPEVKPLGFFDVGEIVGGSYEILDFLGRGAMGIVYKAKHTGMPAEYALKILTGNQLTNLNFLRFQNEAQAIAKLNHPNIIAVYNFGLHEGSLPFYVMDLLDGENLFDKIDAFGPPPVNTALSIFIEVCAGLGFAHKKGILHRDVKPANFVILDAPDVRGAKVKVVDFGIVKFAEELKPDAQKLTAMGDVCGSPSYMSPEQASGLKIDPRSDVYSLGCSLFQTLTGKLPFRGRSATDTMMMHFQDQPPTLASQGDGRVYSADLEKLVARMLAKAPMDRYQSMDAVAIELKNVLDGKPLGTPPVSEVADLKPSDGATAGGARKTVYNLNTMDIANARIERSSEIEGRFDIGSGRGDEADDDDSVDHTVHAEGAAITVKMMAIAAAGLVIGAVAVAAIFLWPKSSHAPTAAAVVVPSVRGGNASNTKADPIEAETVKGSTLKDGKPVHGLERQVTLESNSMPDIEHGKMPVLTKAKYFSSVVTVGGKKYVEFDFPKPSGSQFLAYLCTTRKDFSSSEDKVKFPLGSEITLCPELVSQKMPEFFEKFRPGEISGLYFTGFDPTDELFNMVLMRVSGIKRVFIGSCPQLTENIVPALDRLNLTLFFAPGCRIDGSQLALTHFWQNLRHLNLSRCKNLSPVCEKIPGNKNLVYLNISDNRLNDSDYQHISKLPNLKVLDISRNQISPAGLRSLSALKSLTRIDALYTRADSASLTALIKGLPKLKLLTISRGMLKSDDLKALEQNCPRVKVVQLTGEQVASYMQRLQMQDINTGLSPEGYLQD